MLQSLGAVTALPAPVHGERFQTFSPQTACVMESRPRVPGGGDSVRGPGGRRRRGRPARGRVTRGWAHGPEPALSESLR